MLKKLLLSLIPAVLFSVSLAFAADETITVTTYYPSPYGSYNELKTNYLQFGKTSVSPTQNDICSPEEEGKIAYNSKEKMLYLCLGSYWVRLVRDLSRKEMESRFIRKPTPALSNSRKTIPEPISIEEMLSMGIKDVDAQNYEEAVLEFAKVISSDPNYSEGYKNRAVVYYFMQEYGKAWDDVHRAEKLGAVISPQFLEDLRKASNRKD